MKSFWESKTYCWKTVKSWAESMSTTKIRAFARGTISLGRLKDYKVTRCLRWRFERKFCHSASCAQAARVQVSNNRIIHKVWLTLTLKSLYTNMQPQYFFRKLYVNIFFCTRAMLYFQDRLCSVKMAKFLKCFFTLKVVVSVTFNWTCLYIFKETTIIQK